jgi:class 3 adenylate cyclase
MDAVGSEQAAIMGLFDAGPMAMVFAATFPLRTRALILVNTAARLLVAPDYPHGATAHQAAAVISHVEETWGTEEQAWLQVPSRAADDSFRRWFARYTRSIAGPGAVRAYLDASLHADARSVLSSLHVPTLVLHRSEYHLFRIEHGRYLADKIGGARLVELPGRDGPLPWESPERSVDAIEELLTGARASTEHDTALVTVLFSDIVDSTSRAEAMGDRRWRELLDEHHRAVRRVLAAFGGELVDTAGDGTLATFTGPGRAIRSAMAIRDALADLGLGIRAGIHIGEVQLREDGIGGITVHIGARVMAKAQPGEILVSRTVRDVIAGSDVQLTSRGPQDLKGVTGSWELFSVTS